MGEVAGAAILLRRFEPGTIPVRSAVALAKADPGEIRAGGILDFLECLFRKD